MCPKFRLDSEEALLEVAFRAEIGITTSTRGRVFDKLGALAGDAFKVDSKRFIT